MRIHLQCGHGVVWMEELESIYCNHNGYATLQYNNFAGLPRSVYSSVDRKSSIPHIHVYRLQLGNAHMRCSVR